MNGSSWELYDPLHRCVAVEDVLTMLHLIIHLCYFGGGGLQLVETSFSDAASGTDSEKKAVIFL